MRYSIYINQFCWAINNFHSLDITDLALFDFVKSFMLSDRCETIVYEKRQYFWINPSTIIKEMPILGITTTRGINKRIDNLIEAELLERCPNNQSNQKTYLKMGNKYNMYECYHPNESSALGTSVPSTWNECSNNNNIIDKNIKKENISKDILEKDLDFPIEAEENPIPPSSARPLSLKVKYADFVSMTEKEHDKLVAEYGEDATRECISILNNYKGSKGKKYKNDYLAILSWVIDRYKENKGKYALPKSTTPAPKTELWKEMGFNNYEEYKNTILK